MTPQRRTALVSVVAAAALVGIKLSTGLATGSLGLISEALHSGTDLVAALLTFFAVGVAVRPADTGHPYGHGKAEHLSALAEAAILAALSIFVAYTAVQRFGESHEVDVTWWAIAIVLVVMAVDASRMSLSFRVAREHGSAALAASALHFGSDLAGTTAVLAGLLLARAGYHEGDAAAALFVAALVLVAALRLIRSNVDVLMDRTPVAAEEAARGAIGELEPSVELRRLRMREAGGRHFADVVIGVPPGAAVGQGHALADAVENAVQRAVPRSDVVVHVEPADEAAYRERAHAAALAVPRVREVHNVTVLEIDGALQISLHLKLPGELALEEAHDTAEAVERAIHEAIPAAAGVQTHLEPLTEAAAGAEVFPDREDVAEIVIDATGRRPRELRFLTTDDGVVAFLTVAVDASMPLAHAHQLASALEERIRAARPDIAEVIVHTEP
ncbi:MAG TPA: cation diffusion facilitator family transporter [Gaiellaceae bacterium]|nr:cation diffusion facilitator family transporter [Gaiellaceae bacterium]